MSGEPAPKVRFVLCPKCRRLLQESPDFDVYKCGGCGTVLQAKKRRSGAANSKSSTRETDASSRNAQNPVSDDKQQNKGEQLAVPQENGLRVKATSSSSGECSADGNYVRGQVENGKFGGEEVVPPQENDEREKATRSSSGDCSSNGNDGRVQIENGKNGECNGEHVVLRQENGETEKVTGSSLGDCYLDRNDEKVQTENGEYNEEQVVIPQGNGERERATISSLKDCSLDGDDGSSKIENCESNQDQENGFGGKPTSSSSGESSLDGDDGRSQIENSECNLEQAVLPQENGFGEKPYSSSSGESSLDGSVLRDQIENRKCNREQMVLPQDKGLREKATSSSSGEYSLGRNGGRDPIQNDECDGEKIGPCNLSEELEKVMSENGCSNELTNLETKTLSEFVVQNSVEDANDTNLQLPKEDLSDESMPLEGAVGELIREDVNGEKSSLVGVSSEVDITGSDLGVEELDVGSLLPQRAEQELVHGLDRKEANNDKSSLVGVIREDANGEKSSLVGVNSEVNIIGSDLEGAEEANYDISALVGANPEVDIPVSNKAEADKKLNMCVSDGEDPKAEKSAQVCANSEVEIIESSSTGERSSTEKFVAEKGNIAHHKPEEGTFDGISYPYKQQRQAQKIIHHSFDCVRPVDTSDAIEVISPTLELSGNLGELSKSSTTRSSHAYEGSVSSNDGVDEQFCRQQLDSLDNTYTVANGVLEGSSTVANGVLEGSSRKGKGLVESMLHGDLEPRHQSYFPSAKHHVLKARRGDQYEVPESTRLGFPHWTRRKDEFLSRMPFQGSVSQSGYESGSPSNQTYSTFRSPDPNEDPDQEHVKLLRMLYKLQDQHNRTRYVKEETNGRLSTDVSFKGKHNFAYHIHDLHEGRFYHGLDYPRCYGRCNHGINGYGRHNFSQPYLAEATIGSHHVDHPCFHCCSQELPSQAFYQHSDLSKYHPGQNCCSSHHSLPSSPPPPWFASSKVPAYGDEMKSGDQMHMALEVKNYLREKQNFNKQHYRPVAGGAPFVTCHKCLKLLRLPADFLLYKRVYHRLRCGACSEVLKFSMQNGSHIVSYVPNVLQSPSSDLDYPNEMIAGSNLHSASHTDPVSYSDEYGHSVSKSYSSEGDPVSLTPSHPSHGNEHDEHDKPSVVSQGNFEPIPDEKVASRGSSTIEIEVGTKKLPSEMETRSPPQKSSLHQLMGYSSPSQVIRGVKSFVEGEETILNGEDE